jgi:hypothetical protein
MMVMIDCILDQIWRQYEIDNRRTLTIGEVAEGTGIHRDVISRMRRGLTGRYDSDVVARLSQFFGVREGEPVPFLVVRYVEDVKAAEPTP